MNDIQKIPLEDETVSTKEKIEWLTRKISGSIEYMRKERNRNSKRASGLKLLTIFLSGAGAILLGVQISGYDALFRNLAFVLITIVTLINALEPFFNYRALWIEQERALAGFYKVQDDLDFYLAGTKSDQVSSNELNRIYEEIRIVWDHHSNAWLAYRKGDSPIQFSMV